MLSRALSPATVILLIGCLAPVPAQAQAQNLEAGKSPSQIFAGTCSACHKSPRGLLKAVPAGSLPGYLRQHYTTSSDMASLLSAFLISNGATDTRYVGSQPKQEKDAKSEAKPAAPPEQLDRHGHRLHAAVPAQEAAKQRLSKRGKPGSEDLPKTDAARSDAAKTDAAKTDSAKDEPAKGEPAREDKPQSDTAKYEGDKLPGEGKSEAARIEAPKPTGSSETTALRADPVPPVAPAPQGSSTVPPAVSGGTPELSSTPSGPPPAMTASMPPRAPAAPAGPPTPPISQ